MGHMLNEYDCRTCWSAAPACRAKTPAGCRVPTTPRSPPRRRWWPSSRSEGIEKAVAHARGVPRICVGVEGEARRHHPEAVAQAGGFVRLGPHAVHDGRHPQPRASSRSSATSTTRGRIYRGVRMVNWDPAARTALSDEEVVYQGVAWQALLPALCGRGDGRSYLVVATTRPETILGDTALCVNPDDERYEWLPQDARVVVPLVGPLDSGDPRRRM